MLWATPPPQVSYAREIAPVFAMRCNGCHGDAGGLSTRTYPRLMAGGNLGKVIIAGDANASLLIHFIEGRRGEAHRMPIGGKPLSGEQIQRIRQWIGEGARADTAELPHLTRSLPRIRVPRAGTARISFRISTSAYLTLTVRHPTTHRVLLERAGAVKPYTEETDFGKPGELLSWEVRADPRWPKRVDIELLVQYGGEVTVSEFAIE